MKTFSPQPTPRADSACRPDPVKSIATGVVLFLVAQVGAIAGPNAGGVDPGFSTEGGANGEIQTVLVQPDEKILVGGRFTQFGNTPRSGLARLFPNGSLDTSFDPGAGGDVRRIALQPDGKVIVAGPFSSFAGEQRKGLARLHADGSLDLTFDPATGPDGPIETIQVTGAGKILVGGSFSQFAGVARWYLVRLNADGTVDEGFVPDTRRSFAIEHGIYRVLEQPDGSIVAAGLFEAGAELSNLVRFTTTGTVDPVFNGHFGWFSYLFALALQPDGKLIIAGTQGGGTDLLVRRISADRTIDSSFAEYTPRLASTGGNIFDLALQPDGKIIAAGLFATQSGIRGIVRLQEDGTPDPAFDPGEGPNDAISTVALALQGKILIGGRFTEVNGVPQNRIARLLGDIEQEALSIRAAGSGLAARLGISVAPGKRYLLEASENLRQWILLKTIMAESSSFEFMDPSSMDCPRRFYRLILME